jgi:preprotein translocase subunit SecY
MDTVIQCFVFIIILILVCFFGAAKIKIIVNGDHASKHKRYKDIRYASDTEEALETWFIWRQSNNQN